MDDFYAPDFKAECRVCGTSPCVIVVGHKHQPHTDLCGVCFWNDTKMVAWERWNDREGETDES